MVNPPTAVKLGLESICLLLNRETTDWKAIRAIIVKDDFINTILNFHTDNITTSIKDKMLQKYLNNPEYDFEKVNRASQACGPLVKWATAQVCIPLSLSLSALLCFYLINYILIKLNFKDSICRHVT
jgi:dynein heavy chain 1, cytosolic